MQPAPLLRVCAIALVVLTASGACAEAGRYERLLADRTAVERIYHGHRVGTPRPFAEAVPPAVIARLVRSDLEKEHALACVYGVRIDAGRVAAEVRRIDATTRAPDVLAAIRRALDDDPQRFAGTVARPLVVGRVLRARFDFDPAIHAAPREQAEAVRDRLLAAEAVAAMQETTWRFGPRPERRSEVGTLAGPPPKTRADAGSGDYAVAATARVARPLGRLHGSAEHREAAAHYFEDLPADLRRVLRAQLQSAGDVSAVIETARGFLVFKAVRIDAQALTAARGRIPKVGLDAWLATLPDAKLRPGCVAPAAPPPR